jgi:uncharacterized protein
MAHPVVHAEIRSKDPDATRKFFGDLLGWTYPSEGAVPGYTVVDTGVPNALYTAISPLHGGSDLVTFSVGVDDITSVIELAAAVWPGIPRARNHDAAHRGLPSVC